MNYLASDAATLIQALNLNAERDLASVCRELAISTQRGHYLLRKFNAQGLIKKRTFIDISRLGVYQFAFYARLVFVGEKQREYFDQKLLNEPSVVDVYALNGSYNTGVVIYARNPQQAHHVWERILSQTQPTIFKRSLTVRMRLTHLRRRILSQDPPALEYLETSGSEPDMTIDAVDDRILRGINSYPKLSLRQVSAKIGIPHSTTNLRLKKMREAKILLGSIYGIYTSKLGLSTYRLLLKFRSRGSALDSLISKCIHENKGIYLSIVTFGEWDHEFVVEARTADEYGQTVRSVETIMSHVLEATESIELVAYTKVSDYFSLLPNT